MVFLFEFNSSFVALRSNVYMIPLPRILLDISLQLAQSFGLLCIPNTWTMTVGPWAFAVFSPAAWNSLPVDLCDPSLRSPSFRKKLKTYLFNTVT